MVGSTHDIIVDKCAQCGKRFISFAYVCAACGSEEFVSDAIKGKGKIYTHTTIRVAPEAFRSQVPYPMAVIELPHGLRLTARMLLKEGQKMEIEGSVSCIGKDEAGYWFELE